MDVASDASHRTCGLHVQFAQVLLLHSQGSCAGAGATTVWLSPLVQVFGLVDSHLHSPHISIVVKFTKQIIVLFGTYSRVLVIGCTSLITVVSKGPGPVDQGLHPLTKHVVAVGF